MSGSFFWEQVPARKQALWLFSDPGGPTATREADEVGRGREVVRRKRKRPPAIPSLPTAPECPLLLPKVEDTPKLEQVRGEGKCGSEEFAPRDREKKAGFRLGRKYSRWR